MRKTSEIARKSQYNELLFNLCFYGVQFGVKMRFYTYLKAGAMTEMVP